MYTPTRFQAFAIVLIILLVACLVQFGGQLANAADCGDKLRHLDLGQKAACVSNATPTRDPHGLTVR